MVWHAWHAKIDLLEAIYVVVSDIGTLQIFALLNKVDADGLLKYSVVVIGRSLNHVSAKFPGVIRVFRRLSKRFMWPMRWLWSPKVAPLQWKL